MKKSLLICMCFISFTVYAKPSTDGHPTFEAPRPGLSLISLKKGHHGRFQHMLDYLDLNEAQETQIKKLIQQHWEYSQKFFEEVNVHRKELFNLSFSDDFTEVKAKSLINKSTELHNQKKLQESKLDHSIFRILTPEQRHKMKKKIIELESKHKRPPMSSL